MKLSWPIGHKATWKCFYCQFKELQAFSGEKHRFQFFEIGRYYVEKKFIP